MSKKYNGFTLIEVLVAFSFLMLIVFTLLPVYLLIKEERNVLEQRRLTMMALHDELQVRLLSQHENDAKLINILNREVQFTFILKEQELKGCANWTNVKERNEEICYMGYIER